jgi:hypothetical protein
MTSKNRRLYFVIAILVFSSLACGLVTGQPGSNPVVDSSSSVVTEDGCTLVHYSLPHEATSLNGKALYEFAATEPTDAYLSVTATVVEARHLVQKADGVDGTLVFAYIGDQESDGIHAYYLLTYLPDEGQGVSVITPDSLITASGLYVGYVYPPANLFAAFPNDPEITKFPSIKAELASYGCPSPGTSSVPVSPSLTPAPMAAADSLAPSQTPQPLTPTPPAPIPGINFRSITLSEFHGSLLFDFPIVFEIPTNYVFVPDTTVWMPQEHLERFVDSVPIDVEFFNVLTSTSVGYDGETDTFIGVPYGEQEKADFEAAVGGKITRFEQRKVGQHPVVILEISDIENPGLPGYIKYNAIYIATLVGTNAINISTLSSPEKFARNEYIWANLIATISSAE